MEGGRAQRAVIKAVVLAECTIVSQDFENISSLLSKVAEITSKAESPSDLLRRIARDFVETLGEQDVHVQISQLDAVQAESPEKLPSESRTKLITGDGGQPLVRVTVQSADYDLALVGAATIGREALESWIRALAEIVRFGLRLFAIRQTESLQSARQDFADAILGVAASSPEVDVLAICKQWQAATMADSVWLVLKNPYTDVEPWEVFAQYPTVQDPEQLTFGKGNLAEYSVLSRQVVSVDNIAGWKATWNKETYSILCGTELGRVGAKIVDCIPLLRPILSQKSPVDACPVAEGAILLSYSKSNGRIRHPTRSLMVMGQLTASALLNSYQAEQRRILVTLNELAERYLTRVTKNLYHLRQDYLNAVIQLIKDSINVAGVSIFYRDITGTRVECLATTGLCDSRSVRIPADSLSNVAYPVGVGLTGRCFESGKPIILNEEKLDQHKPLYIEMPMTEPIGPTPAAFSPIPAPHSESYPAAGVIRCAFHTSRIIKQFVRRFDPMDIQTLGFIARQLAPALHSMDISIRREQTISITKHDLRTPLQMTQRTFPLIEGIVERVSPKNLALKDVKTAIDVALSLVDRLEPDPAEVKDFDPTVTLLEGDIVARLKAMLSHLAQSMRKMTIKCGNFSDVPPVLVDRGLIERALSNLVVNAIKYGERESEISIVPSRAQDGFLINVINYGIGVAQEDAPHLFRANYRSPRTSSLALGSGLGLTIAEAAMERHGGKLLLTKLKDPTVFSLYFPRKLIVNQ